MPLTITPGLGGGLQFPNLTPLVPAQISENISRFWEMPNPLQVETLASAYHHLSRLQEPNTDLLEKLGEMVKRFEAREPTIAADNFIMARLVGEVAKLKDSVPPAKPRSDRPAVDEDSFTQDPRPEAPDRRPSRRDSSLILYGDGQGGFYPSLWRDLSEEMRRELKILALSREGRISELSNDEVTHADFLADAVGGWILSLTEPLSQSAPMNTSLRNLLPVISEMVTLMARPTLSVTLTTRFWDRFDGRTDVKSALIRLSNAKTLPALATDEDRAILESTIQAVEAALKTCRPA